MFSSRTGANFRKHLAPTIYKVGRKEKPEGYWSVVDAIEARFKSHRVDGLEADDLLGIAGTDLARWGQAVIVSIDKDLGTVPGVVFNPNKDCQPRRISTPQADYLWMTQTLTGDPCDGYGGCPKIGPVKAGKILAECGLQLGAMWPAVVETFDAAGLSHADALLQARLSRILRCRPTTTATTRSIKLWHLTKPETLALSDIGSTSPPSSEAIVPTHSCYHAHSCQAPRPRPSRDFDVVTRQPSSASSPVISLAHLGAAFIGAGLFIIVVVLTDYRWT
jgi:hypothetical protein